MSLAFSVNGGLEASSEVRRAVRAGDGAVPTSVRDDINVARRSGDDGFDIDSCSARLGRNRALRSAGEGFELR